MLQKLKKLLEIITIIPTSDDNKLKEEGLKIINELGYDHINDKLTITTDRKGTILDCLILCDSQNGVRLNNATLKELENAIIQLGGKSTISEHDTATDLDFMREMLNRRMEIDGTHRKIAIACLSWVYAGASIGSRLGAILESKGQVQSIGWIGSTFGAVLGGQLFTLGCGAVMQAGTKLMLTRTLEREGSAEVMQAAREVAQPLLNANVVTNTKIAISAAFGAGITTTMLRIGITPLTFRGVITLSEVNMEWKESLMSGLITAIGAGIGTAVSIKLLRRFFGTPNARIEQANIDQSIEELSA